jgi:hypothetical protein
MDRTLRFARYGGSVAMLLTIAVVGCAPAGRCWICT